MSKKINICRYVYENALKSFICNPSGTNVVNGKYLRTLNWYDNEWGYSNRVVDLVNLLNKFI